ncbi:MAG: hypothetical protein NTU44_00500 [Bacteroidetes bacterium]|nr:hypothetical protein [Bacteroidota bacterium]
MIKKDSMPIGGLLGIVFPIGSFIAFYLIFFGIVSVTHIQPFITLNTLILLSIAPNFFILRFYYNTKDKEITGKGMLLASLALIILFFIFVHKARLGTLPGLMP